MEKIAFASDHAGYELKLKLEKYVESKGYEIEDFGTDSEESRDYPDFAHPAAMAVEDGRCAFGIAAVRFGQRNTDDTQQASVHTCGPLLAAGTRGARKAAQQRQHTCASCPVHIIRRGRENS